MKRLDLLYLRYIAEKYATGRELYPEDNEEHKKKIFTDLLRFSHKIGYPISSNEDFKEIEKFFETIVGDLWLSAQDKLVLKQLKIDIYKYYPKMWAERLQKKQTTEAENILIRQKELQETDKQQRATMTMLFNQNNENLTTLKQEHTTTTTAFNKMRKIDEWKNTVTTAFLDERYISSLRGNSSNPWAIGQLRKIEGLIETNPNHGISKDRLSITNTWIVIEEYTIPSKLEDLVRQSFKDISNNPEQKLHPLLALRLLNFFGKLTNQPITRILIDELENNEAGGKEFIDKINTPANKEIIKTIAKVLWFNGTIPMYARGNKIIRMDISEGDERGFSYHNSKDVFKNCIVPLTNE